MILENAHEDAVTPLAIYENGEIYMQSLSSMQSLKQQMILTPAIPLSPNWI